MFSGILYLDMKRKKPKYPQTVGYLKLSKFGDRWEFVFSQWEEVVYAQNTVAVVKLSEDQKIYGEPVHSVSEVLDFYKAVGKYESVG